jgi:hypothetical protein
MPDRMHDTLDALRTDIDRAPLADSGAVRRRGEQRTRNQLIGSAVAVVVLVAGVIGVAGGLSGDNRSTDLPATPSPTATATATQLSLATNPFLPVDELTGFGGYDPAGPFIDANQEPAIEPEQCAVRPAEWKAEEVQGTRFYQDGSEATIREYVLRFDDTGSAEQASLRQAYIDLAGFCPATVGPDEGTLTKRESVVVPGLEYSIQHSRLFVPAVDSEPSYYEVATAQRGNVVVVLEWQASGNAGGDGPQDWTWTAERLETALDAAID